jgi:hypothetical protein
MIIIKRWLCQLLCWSLPLMSISQIQVSADKHYLTKNGKSFFWLGDTAWELFHRLTREEARIYLKNRSDKGYTVIQAVALAELDGANAPNAYGDIALINGDINKPNETYFKLVDDVIDEANKLGLTVALLPAWGDKWNKDTWGVGPEIFTPENARIYGSWIAKRYKDKDIIWVLGGDRNPKNEKHYAIIRSMAAGIKEVVGNKQLLTYHTAGAASSFNFFADDTWIDIHMSQTGHYAGSPDYKVNIKARELKTIRPHVNGEPNYEDHPNDFKPVEKGWMDDFDTREAAYWNMLSGGAGHTYGNHNIWQFYDEKREAVNNARTCWQFAMNYPGAYQVGFMRLMFEKRNWQSLLQDQSLIEGDNPEGLQYKMAAVSSAGDFMMVYIPYGNKTTVRTAKIKGEKLQGWWFNPRDGRTIPIAEFNNEGKKEFTPSSVGRGSDWLLIIDDASKHYPDPQAG